MTAAVLTGVFGILGALLGAAGTYYAQHRIAGRAEAFARAERLRAERIEVYSAYAGAITEARRADMDRWWQRREAPRESDIYRRARDESYRRRADARRELFRLQLLSSDPELDRLASIAYHGIGDLHRAESREQLEALAHTKTEQVGAFIARARDQLAMQSD